MKLTNLFLSMSLVFTFVSCNSGDSVSSSESSVVGGSEQKVNPNLAKPIFTPEGGTYLRGEVLELKAPIDGTSVLITMDGSKPTYTPKNYTFCAAKQSFSQGSVGSFVINAVTLDTDNSISELASQSYNLIANPDASNEAVPLLQYNYNYNPEMSAGLANYFSFKTETNTKYIFDTCDSYAASTETEINFYSDVNFTSAVAADKFSSSGEGVQAVLNNTTASTYYVKVSEKTGKAVSNYLVRAFVPTVSGFASTIDPEATMNGYSSTFTKCSRHFYKFTAKAGKKYYIFTDTKDNNPNPNLDTDLVLYKKDLAGIKATGSPYNSGTCTNCSLIDLDYSAETTDAVLYFMVKAKSDSSLTDFGAFVQVQ